MGDLDFQAWCQSCEYVELCRCSHLFSFVIFLHLFLFNFLRLIVPIIQFLVKASLVTLVAAETLGPPPSWRQRSPPKILQGATWGNNWDGKSALTNSGQIPGTQNTRETLDTLMKNFVETAKAGTHSDQVGNLVGCYHLRFWGTISDSKWKYIMMLITELIALIMILPTQMISFFRAGPTPPMLCRRLAGVRWAGKYTPHPHPRQVPA